MGGDMMELFKVLGVGLGVFGILIFGIGYPIISCVNATHEADCTLICETRHTHMVDVSDFGCLCDDGSLVQSPQHTTVVPVSTPIIVSH